MKRENRPPARQAAIDRARGWRERRDRLRVSWIVLAEACDIEPSRFESILCARRVPDEAEVAAIEATLAAMEGPQHARA